MALKKSTDLYEVLVRFGPEGYRGAHVIDAETVMDGDEVLAHREHPARPVTKAELGSLLGARNATLIEAADKAIIERDKANDERDDAKHAAMLANERAAKAEGHLAGVTAERDEQADELRTLRAEIKRRDEQAAAEAAPAKAE